MPLDQVFSFLDKCFALFPNKDKYFVDLSGKGEPLLALDQIIAIRRYCRQKSDELRREVLVQFVCNGTLLTKKISDLLQNEGILFGVSVDGLKQNHDAHRKDARGFETFDIIMKNVKAISHREYVGAACTLTKEVFSLKRALIGLSRVFNTVSFKPARNCAQAIDERALKGWIESYDELALFLEEEIKKGDMHYLRVLLNGDDYFGKFIRRLMLGERTPIRCGAGISRVALDENGRIYCCPAACGIDELSVGSGTCFSKSAFQSLAQRQIEKPFCRACSYRNICGGECLVEFYLSNGLNKAMCSYKQRLIELSMHLVLVALNSPIYEKLYSFCAEVNSRRRLDPNLAAFLNEHPELSFTKAKKLYDSLTHRY